MTVMQLNTYNNSVDNLKPKHSLSITNKTTGDLYEALMMTEDTNEEANQKNKIKDLLVSDTSDQLSELDKIKIWYTLDYLRIRGIKSDIFSKLTAQDFSKIKSHKTANYRAEKLINIIIEKASDSLAIKDNDKTEFTNDIDEHVNALIRGRNAEIGNNIAEQISLTRITTKRARFYGKKIDDKIKKCTDKYGNIDWSKCYMDVIKLANYSTLDFGRRTTHRYIVPIKFSRRNINKKTESTLRALKAKSENSNDPKEILAINYLTGRLQKAYTYYKEHTGVSNTEFDNLRELNRDNIVHVSDLNNNNKDSYRRAA